MWLCISWNNDSCLCIGECPSNSPFLKNNGAEAHCFKEWRDTRTFSNLKSTINQEVLNIKMLLRKHFKFHLKECLQSCNRMKTKYTALSEQFQYPIGKSSCFIFLMYYWYDVYQSFTGEIQTILTRHLTLKYLY
jgi:hypothetical protein